MDGVCSPNGTVRRQEPYLELSTGTLRNAAGYRSIYRYPAFALMGKERGRLAPQSIRDERRVWQTEADNRVNVSLGASKIPNL